MITHSREQFLKYLQELFKLQASNTEDTTNKSFIVHCNIDSYHLCKVRILIKDLVLNYFADFSKSILIFTEVLVKAIKQFKKNGREKGKIIKSTGQVFLTFTCTVTSVNP